MRIEVYGVYIGGGVTLFNESTAIPTYKGPKYPHKEYLSKTISKGPTTEATLGTM